VNTALKSEFRKVYSGLRWSLLYGTFTGLECTAVIELQKVLQYYVPYTPLVVAGADEAGFSTGCRKRRPACFAEALYWMESELPGGERGPVKC